MLSMKINFLLNFLFKEQTVFLNDKLFYTVNVTVGVFVPAGCSTSIFKKFDVCLYNSVWAYLVLLVWFHLFSLSPISLFI